MAVQMELSRVLIREVRDAQIIELREIDGERTFPIVVGRPEAYAIERRLKGIEPPRPQTHDLLASIITHLGGSLSSIVIHELREGTFFAKVIIQQGDVELVIDSRPSDAIALGIAQEIPIFVEESVLDEVEQDIVDQEEIEEDPEIFDWD